MFVIKFAKDGFPPRYYLDSSHGHLETVDNFEDAKQFFSPKRATLAKLTIVVDHHIPKKYISVEPIESCQKNIDNIDVGTTDCHPTCSGFLSIFASAIKSLKIQRRKDSII